MMDGKGDDSSALRRAMFSLASMIGTPVAESAGMPR
jgi:hypothetical protein